LKVQSFVFRRFSNREARRNRQPSKDETQNFRKNLVGMKYIILTLALLFVFSLNAFAQTDSKPAPNIVPANFKSDNCSLFPDCDYADCCVEHDLAYFSGGSWKMRWRADKKLFKCVAAKKGFQHKLIAPVMWAGVRVFGVPFLPTPFRWGFGRVKTTPNKSSK
jgi:hypothetical protein